MQSSTETQLVSIPYAQSSSHHTTRLTSGPSDQYLNPTFKSFTHDELLTSIPSTPPPVSTTSYCTPINSLLTALADFELSIEIRDRLTRSELFAFDKVFVAKVKNLGKYRVEGSYSQHLQVLKRLTKARAHLKKHKPEVVDDISRVVAKLLDVLCRDDESVILPQQAKKEIQLLTGMDAKPSVVVAPKVQAPQKMQLSSIVFNSRVIGRAPGYHQLYLLFNEEEGCLQIKGLNGRPTTDFGDKKIAFANIRSIGDISNTEVSIGFRDGLDIGFHLKDEKDAEVLLQKLELLSGVTTYTARYY
ncbi:MAG: hypothetical protein Q9195_007708 [Heterodermia aff. obscurata]